MALLDRLLQAMKREGGSDLLMLEGQPPKYRLHGHVEPIPGEPVLSREQITAYLKEIAPPRHWKRYVEGGDADFAYAMGDSDRFRANYYKQHFGFAAVFRIIPVKILTLEELKTPPRVGEFTTLRNGLVLVTGPTGSGKSTTLAAMLHDINLKYPRHILTIEEPIEFVHQSRQSIITQREVGDHTESFASALRAAAREDADVILVGEMRDLETIALALSAAEMGVLVFGTLHTNSAAKTIDRIVNVFPAQQQAQIRAMLAGSLRGVVSQVLCRKADGKGRVACHEILVSNVGVAAAIRRGEIAKINSIISTGSGEGMIAMDESLDQKLKAGLINPMEAYLKAQEKKRFEEAATAYEEKMGLVDRPPEDNTPRPKPKPIPPADPAPAASVKTDSAAKTGSSAKADSESKVGLPSGAGKTFAKVACQADPSQLYTARVPANYSPQTRYPILYCLDPDAGGAAALERHARAADRFGWIVVASLVTRNGQKPAEREAVFQALWDDTHKKFSLDDQRAYAAGASGSSRTVSWAAFQREPPLAGMISHGAGFGRSTPGAQHKTVVAGLVSERDVNYYEVQQMRASLSESGIRLRIWTHEGDPHTWASDELCYQSVRYLELLWRCDHDQVADPVTQAILKEEADDAEALLGQPGHFLDGYLWLKELASLAGATPAVSGIVPKIHEASAAARCKQETNAAAVLADFENKTAKLGSLPKLQQRIPMARAIAAKFAETTISHRLRCEERALRGQAKMLSRTANLKGTYQERAYYVSLSHALAPEDVEMTFQYARLLADGNQPDAAIETLGKALEKNLENPARIANDPSFQNLRNHAGFQQILARLKGG